MAKGYVLYYMSALAVYHFIEHKRFNLNDPPIQLNEKIKIVLQKSHNVGDSIESALKLINPYLDVPNIKGRKFIVAEIEKKENEVKFPEHEARVGAIVHISDALQEINNRRYIEKLIRFIDEFLIFSKGAFLTSRPEVESFSDDQYVIFSSKPGKIKININFKEILIQSNMAVKETNIMSFVELINDPKSSSTSKYHANVTKEVSNGKCLYKIHFDNYIDPAGDANFDFLFKSDLFPLLFGSISI